MTIEDIYDLNEDFQKRAFQLSELIPTGGFAEATSLIIRSSRRIHTNLEMVLQSRTEVQLGNAIEKVEEEWDEIIFVLDQLEIANQKQKIRLIDDFLKQGYDLLSIYSACIDQIIKEKIPTEE